MKDITPFLKLAAAENWVAEPWEFEFLLSAFSQGCFTARGDSGEIAGFVTSLRHNRSGWIGNLIVSAEYRGQRIGERLFVSALEALRSSGVETFWLTASKSGKSLYEKYGFSSIDTIIRWSGRGRQRFSGQETLATDDNVDSFLNNIDYQAWGDQRVALIAATAGRGTVLLQETGFVVVQQCGNSRQLGPFSAPGYSTADALLKAALNTIPNEIAVCLDAPASNRTALKLFNRNRMRISGSNELMYAGVKPAYQPEMIYGLATMGSCG
ncbi:MAG: GNAT family N-acetyltransferase [Desulfuromonadaceae bacterium]|nr:GNAT family N-acetyltransferase [Desulfuromonadaceae bacterium]